MKFTITEFRESPTVSASKANWRAKNPARHRETSHTARDTEIKSAGFIGVDGEGMRTHCLNDSCTCQLYAQRNADNSRCKTCGHAEDSHYHAYVLLVSRS